MSVSDLVDRLRAGLRDDLDETRDQPLRETAEAVVLGLVGLGWLLRAVTHVYGYLALTDESDPHPLTTDWGIANSPVLGADTSQRWRMGLATCGVGLVLAVAMRYRLDVWSHGPLVGGLILANWLVLICDPITVQVLPDGD